MGLSREQILGISSLKLADRLEELSDGLIERFCGTLVEFIENYPGIEADLKKAMFIGDYDALSRLLAELGEALANIHADDLLRECERLRETFAAAPPETLEAELTAFLSATATLSVDIQMEQHKSVEAVKPKTRKYPVVYADDSDPSPASQKSILGVDDIPVTLNLLKAALVSAGFKFNGVTSGAAALDFITKFTPDLFILDIEMPKMNGFELATRIREAGLCAPIVFLTGNTTKDYLLRAVKAGAADFIVKPVNADSVAAKVKKILS